MADQPDKQSVPPGDNPTPDDEQQHKPPTEQEKPGGLAGWHEPPVEPGSSRPVDVESWFEPEDAATAAPDAPAQPDEKPAQPVTSPEPPESGAWYTPLDAQIDALLSGADETIAEIHEPEPEPEPPVQASEDTQAQPLGETQAQPSQAEPDAPAQEPPASDEGWSVPTGASITAALIDASEPSPDDTSMDGEQATRILATQAPESAPGESTPVAEATSPQAVVPSEDAQPSEQVEDQPAMPELSPAEAAMLAEQRAAQESQPPQVEPSPEPAVSDVAPEGASDAVEEAALPGAAEDVPAAAPTPAPTPTEPAQPSPFEEVERKVKVLRERYRSGHLTREQLQNELRSLMILDDDGHWWMLGLESDRWYFYDGRDWVAANPPGYEERVRGSALRTETGMQDVVVDEGAGFASEEGELAPIEIDEDGMPLPKRVPQEDPGATLVSPSTPFMEPMRPSEAPTYAKNRQVDAQDAAYVTHPARDQDIPARPDSDEGAGTGDLTIRSIPVPDEGATIAGSRAAQAQAAAAARGEAVRLPDRQPAEAPKPKLGEFPQPDYSVALGPARNRNTYVKWGIRFAVFGTIAGMALTLLVLLGMIGYYFYKVDQYATAVDNLSERASNFETTLILDAGGATLAEFSDPNTGPRTEVPLAQISPWLIHATVATENETFYTDPGFSVLAILRATYQNLTAGDTVSGASTITQQLARALVLETEFASQRTTERKIVEIIVASEIKRKYTKNEILEIYLNEIFYGNRSYGIEAAAQTYFRKSASELNPAESAFLAGLPQSPAQYDPVVNREAAIQRMQTVLRLMSEANGTGCVYIEHEDLTTWAVPNGGGLCISTEQQPDGSTLYFYKTPAMDAPQEMVLDIALVETAVFKPPVTEFVHPHFVNYVWQQLEETYGPQAIYAAGFRVWTTLDETIQSAAEDTVSQNLAALQARGFDSTNASVVVMRPTDGAVLAMVGSADYYNEDIDGQVNIAFTAQQPGSSIKPLVYLTAFRPNEQGEYWTPASVIWDVSTDFNGYRPTNYDNLFHGPQTARDALANSLNIPAVKALEFAGLLNFTQLAQEAGLTFPLGNPVERNAGLTTALGAVEVRLFDMVKAYAMLAQNGVKVSPYSIVYIEDSKGNEIYRANPGQSGTQVVDPTYAYLITSILSDNAARAAEFGRGAPMELPSGRPAAVKTGTSNDSRDVWTIGYTPQMVVGVWVGNSDNRPMYGLTGYYGAAPIWNAVMETSLADLPVQDFAPPPGILQAEVCNDSGAQASQACASAGGTHVEIFSQYAPPPAAEQDIYLTVEVDNYTGRLVNQYCNDDVVTRRYVVLSDPTAYNWINTTAEGNAWAQQRGLELPLAEPPTEYCDPNQPRPYVVVSFPPQDMTIEGVLPLRGTVSMPNFDRYEIRYGISHDPGTFSEPLLIDRTPKPDAESLLGQFDTRTLENGQYTLRLIVYDTQGGSVTRDIRITVNNPQAAPPPTAAPTLTPAEGQTIPTPTLAPSLTPVP